MRRYLRTLKSHCCWRVIMLGLLVFDAQGENREWTPLQGQKYQAQLIWATPTNALLQSGAQKFWVNLVTLSEADRTFILQETPRIILEWRTKQQAVAQKESEDAEAALKLIQNAIKAFHNTPRATSAACILPSGRKVIINSLNAESLIIEATQRQKRAKLQLEAAEQELAKTSGLTMGQGVAGGGSLSRGVPSGNLDFSDVTGGASASATANPILSPRNQVRTVEVEGTGATTDEALKDAFSSAVRTCIGVIVNAEQVVKNESVIKDEILTYSNGYINNYDDLGSTNKAGLIVRRIRATVILGKLSGKLRERNIAVNEIKGEALFAEATTVNQERKDFRAMLKNIFTDYELGKLWIPRLVERRIKAQDENNATVVFSIINEPNQSAISEFHLALQRLLAQKYKPQRVQIEERRGGGNFVPYYRMVEGLFINGDVRNDKLQFKETHSYFYHKKILLFVNAAPARLLSENERSNNRSAGIKKIYTSLSCTGYEIPADDWENYFQGNVYFRQGDDYGYLASSPGSLTIVGSLKDKQSQEVDFVVAPVDFSLVGCSVFGGSAILHKEGYLPEQYGLFDGFDRFKTESPLLVEKTFPIDNLRRISNIELKLEFKKTD